MTDPRILGPTMTTEPDEFEEFDDFDEVPDDEGDDLIFCPECQQTIYAEAQQCPQCGHWITSGERRTMVWSPRAGCWTKAIACGLLALVALGLLTMVLEFFSGR